MRVAQVLGRARQQCFEQMLMVLVQQRRTSPSRGVLQRGGIEGLGVGPHPVVNTLTRHPEHPGNIQDGAALIVLQDSESASQQAGIPRFAELAAQAPSLSGGQVKPAHAFHPYR